MKLVLANCLKFSREDAVVISFGSEFHNFGAVAENDKSMTPLFFWGGGISMLKDMLTPYSGQI